MNKELSHFAESSKSGTQISRYLVSTYMDDREDEEPIINNVGQDREVSEMFLVKRLHLESSKHIIQGGL